MLVSMLPRMLLVKTSLRRAFSSSVNQNKSRRIIMYSKRMTTHRTISFTGPRPLPNTVPFTFIQANGMEKKVDAKVGSSLMEVGIENDVGIVAACEGTLCCSTCHLIVAEKDFDSIPDMLSDEELDMLDTAENPTPTSRLSCQIIVSSDLAGMTFTVPSSFSDARQL